METKGCLLIFLKLPLPGTVKTRLASAFDEDIALTFYTKFVFDILDTLQRGKHVYKICFYPPDAGQRITEWLGTEHAFIPQKGGDLGERMQNAFLTVFAEGFSNIVLIGSDVPDLPNEVIDQAFRFKKHDAAIGPAHDGGYYLIGFRRDRFLPEVFKGVQWGTSKVYEKTMETFHRNRYRVHVLPVLHDIDTVGDLKDLFLRNRDTAFSRSRTMSYLAQVQHLL